MFRIGWIGLGKMGTPMARNLLSAGHALTVYNRTVAKVAPFRAEGATIASDPAAAAGQAEVVFSILADDAALRQVLLTPGGAVAAMPDGSTLVEMSTVSAEVSGEIAEATAARNIAYIRAPVSGSTTFAEAAKLTFLASGPKSAFEKIIPFLELMGAKHFHVGDGCEARILKLSLNMMIGTSAAMIGEALSLGLKHGLDRKTMLDVIAGSAVASPLIGYKVGPLAARDYTPAFEARMMAKDFDLILGAARRSGTPMPIAAQVREGWSALEARGDGDADFFKYVELASSMAGLDDGK